LGRTFYRTTMKYRGLRLAGGCVFRAKAKKTGEKGWA
jgi:hypothetical protein